MPFASLVCYRLGSLSVDSTLCLYNCCLFIYHEQSIAQPNKLVMIREVTAVGDIV